MDELFKMFNSDRVELMRKEIQGIENSYITSTLIGQFELPDGLFVEKSDQTETKKTSLAKLLGISKKKKEVLKKATIQQKIFQAEKYERVSSFALNYYNNGLDYILERILLQSALFNQPKDTAVQRIKDALRNATHLKFRTNMKGAVMEENTKEIIYIKSTSEN